MLFATLLLAASALAQDTLSSSVVDPLAAITTTSAVAADPTSGPASASVLAQDTTSSSDLATATSSAGAVDPSASQAASVVSSSQYWHERYHGLLSMAIYNPDFSEVCQNQTFTTARLLQSFPDSTAEPWTLVEQWGPTASGLEGATVVIPEMDKVVMIFKGIFGWEQLNMTSTPMEPELSLGCANCSAHAGALQAYLEAKEITGDWAVMKQYVASTGAQWSITGHAFGGMVAQIAALDLGWRGLCHWSHSHGAPRVFNPAAANLYNSLFAGEAGQRTVANQDSVPTIIPESDDYTFTLEGFHIFGTNSTYGMNYNICATDAKDPECIGGDVAEDSLFYYTPIGQCGSPNVANATLQDPVESSLSAEFYATATSTWSNTFVYTTSTPTPSSTIESTTSATSAPGVEAAATAASASARPSSSSSSTPASGAASIVVSSAAMLGVVAAGLMVLA